MADRCDAELLQNWAVSPPELEASVPDGHWFQHVLQLIQQHQEKRVENLHREALRIIGERAVQERVRDAQLFARCASSGASAGGNGGSDSKTKAKRGGGKPKRGTGSLVASRKTAGPALQRSVMEWLDNSLDAILLSEERGIAMDVVMRMRAIADASVRASSADVVEWRELHTSPMPHIVFSEILR